MRLSSPHLQTFERGLFCSLQRRGSTESVCPLLADALTGVSRNFDCGEPRRPYNARMRTFIVAVAAVVGLGAAASDAQKIVFARVFPNAGQVGLFIAAADGSDERRLLTGGEVDYDPVWAPDGTSIVFTSDRQGSADL